MANIITSKLIKIVSRGRYVHKRGVVFGPAGHFYQERVETLKELLTKYADIEIIEKIGDTTVKLNLENVDKDNRRTPISMMEETSDAGENPSEETPKTPDVEGAAVVTDEVKVDETVNQQDDKVVVDGVSLDPTENKEKEDDSNKEASTEETKEAFGVRSDGALISEETPKTPDVEGAAVVTDEVKVDETANQQVNNQKNNQKNKGKNNQKNNGKNNQNSGKASTEVVPEEA